MLHGCHQDDPAHDYSYPECERHLRAATFTEELALEAALGINPQSPRADGRTDVNRN